MATVPLATQSRSSLQLSNVDVLFGPLRFLQANNSLNKLPSSTRAQFTNQQMVIVSAQVEIGGGPPEGTSLLLFTCQGLGAAEIEIYSEFRKRTVNLTRDLQPLHPQLVHITDEVATEVIARLVAAGQLLPLVTKQISVQKRKVYRLMASDVC